MLFRSRFEGGQQEVNGLFYKLVGSVAFAGTPLGDIALNNICADTQGNVYPNAILLGGATCQQILGYPTANNSNPLRVYAPGVNHKCQSACKRDPLSARKRDPLSRWRKVDRTRAFALRAA